ncbi:MAG: ferredoxin [Candidatus Gracilibacteria bacterium]
MKTIKLSHDRKNCIGCHACVAIAPQTWMINPQDGKSDLVGGHKKGRVYMGEIFECDLSDNEKVVKACPMRIIKILNS